MSDKRKYIKKSLCRKEKLGINQKNRTQTSGGTLLNLTKVRITIKGNESMNMNMEKGSIIIF